MANELQKWKGAVQPAESAPSGNELQLWKGAVEPAESAVTNTVVSVPTGPLR